MADWTISPTQFDGVSLTASPFSDVGFRNRNISAGPAYGRREAAVSAPIIGRGSQRVRGQPEPATWVIGVLLDAATEAALKTFKETFSPDRGLVFLRADDGDGTNWRVACAVIQVRQGEGPLSWDVELDVPNPTWETNAQDSQAGGSTSGDSIATSVTNAGNRSLLPVIQAKIRAPKTTLVHDWLFSMRGVIVNRCDYWVSDQAVQLFSNSDGGDDFDTRQIIKNTTDKALVNDAGNIGASDTTILFDTESGAGLDTPDGMAIIDNEQLYYTGNTGTQLTGCVRGIGGTSAATHNNNATINRSRMLKDGADLHVWLDGVRQEDAYVEDIETANTKLITVVTMPPQKVLTLRSAMTAGSPADGGDLEVLEDLTDMIDHTLKLIIIGNETIAYQDIDLKNRKFTTIERGAWGSTAASHSAGADVRRVDHTYVIAHGYAKANAPEAPLSRRPGCQLNSLTPDKMHWGDTTDDPDTAFYDADNPNRPNTFHVDREVAETNKAVALRLDESKSKAAWVDGDVESGKPQAGRLVIATPFGIAASAGAITYDGQTDIGQRLRLLGLDRFGDKEIVLAEHARTALDGEVDEPALSGESIQPDAVLQRLILESVRSSAVGNGLITDTVKQTISFNAVDEGFLVEMVLDQATIIQSIHLGIIQDGSFGATTILCYILRDDAANPEDGTAIAVSGFAGNNLSSTTKKTASFAFNDVQLAAGTYHIAFIISNYNAGAIKLETRAIRTRHTRWRYDSGAGWTEGGDAGNSDAPYFRVLHGTKTQVQSEMEQLNEDDEANIDNVVLTWANGPQIRREASFGNNLHHLNAVISNDDNDRQFTLDCWVKDEATLVIDADAQTVEWTDGNHTIRQPGAVDPSNDKEWLKLGPGAQIVTWTEENMANNEITLLHRGLRT